MKNKIRTLALLVFILTAAAGTALALGGSTAGTASFLVRANDSQASVTLKSTQGIACVEALSAAGSNPVTGYDHEATYGFYYVRVTGPGMNTTVEWIPSANVQYGLFGNCEYSSALEIAFPAAGDYTVTVEPMSPGAIEQYRTADRLLYWEADSTWTLKSQYRCSVGSVPRETACSVYCYDDSGNLLKSFSQRLTSSMYVYPPEIPGYASGSPARYVQVNSGAGTCDPASVTFWYTRGQGGYASGELVMACYDQNGRQIRTERATVTADSYITPPSIPGYRAVSSGVYVTLDTARGICSPSYVDFYYQQEGGSYLPQLPAAGYAVWLKDPYAERIRPQCGPGYGYAVFASMSGSTRLYDPAQIRYLNAHFCVGDWAYVEFGYSDNVLRYGFFEKSLFNPSVSWDSVPSVSLNSEKHGAVTVNTVPYNGPGTNCGSYSSCELYAGTAVHACMECNGWYLCRFYNNHGNNYGDVYLWVPGSSISWY